MELWHLITSSLQESLFYQLAAILILSGVIGFIAVQLRQPLLVAFIGVGLLIGPDVLALMPEDSKAIDTLAALGIALLLFLVGLKLDIGLIRKLGPVALTAGLFQVGMTAALAIGLSLALGFDFKTSALIGVALSFSSTIIVVKLLSDRGAIESLYGKIAIGILIVQDIVVIMAMVVVTALGQEETASLSVSDFFSVFGKVGILLIVTGLFIRFIATPLTQKLARTPELMVIFALGMAAMMAALCHGMDLSKELGGLLAGVALASTPLRDMIAARLAPLRDFLLLFFFVGLGAQLDLDAVDQQIQTALILSGFVLIGKPIIIMTIMGLLGYRKRTGLLSGITLAQISEFSMIFMAMAASAGLASANVVGVVTLTGMITITISVYAMIYQDRIYQLLEKPIGLFERSKPKFEEELPDSQTRPSYDILVFGLGRYGMAMAHEFKAKGASVLGIDFDPIAIRHAQEEGIPCRYGDASDAEFPKFLPLESAKAVVMGFPHHTHGPLLTDARYSLAKTLKNLGYEGHIAVISHNEEDRNTLVRKGIDIILNPHKDAGIYGADQILDHIEQNKKD